jgi:anti-anti-sigma factor
MEMTRTADGGYTSLTITGRLDGYWADHLDAGLTETVRDGHHQLRLNLSDVTFISSAGIAVLVKFYKRLIAIKGGLVITSMSPAVRAVLDMTRLTKLLADESPAAAAEMLVARTLERGNLLMQVFDLAPDARLVCRVVGGEGIHGGTDGAAAALPCPESRFAFGIGAFGANDADCRDRFGEFVAVAGAAGYLPGDETEVPDYLVASDAEAVEIRALQAIACDGAFRQQIRFDVRPPASAVTLGELAAAAVEMAGGAAGLAIIAETAGLVGASLRRSPARAGAGEFFAFPAVRARLTFTSERAFARSLALVAGVVQRGDGPLGAGHVRPLDGTGTLLGHFHAAVFPYHPFRKGRLDLKETVRTLFDGGGPLGLLHLLHDDRQIVGVGDSEFTRGTCWIAPLAG